MAHRPALLLFFLALLLPVSLLHAAPDGIFVPVGQPSPLPEFFEVTAGKTARLDLLLASPLPTDNRCRISLYLSGGPLGAPLSSETRRLTGAGEGKSGERIPLEIPIPAARSGVRFLLRVECIAPARGVLGAIELRVPETDAGAELRSALADRPVQVLGRSPQLKALLTAWAIPFTDYNEQAPAEILLTEEPSEFELDASQVLVVITRASVTTATLTGRKQHAGWSIEARLPTLPDPTTPAAAAELTSIIHFIDQLKAPN